MKKQNQNLKRFLVWLMVLCMLTTQGSISALAAELGSEDTKSVVDTENVTATGITRIEWLHELTTVFDMSVEENNYPDNYFADITSNSEYYYDVMLATEFGLIDVEAGDNVYPDAAATREFVAHTFNACMGYVLEDTTYTFAEASSVTYADDIQVAINQGWFTLNASKQFLPNQQVTSAECEKLIALAETEVASREIDETHSDSYVLKADVIVIPSSVEFALVDDGVYELVGLQTSLAAGNKIALISGDLPIVKRIIAVSSANGVVTVTTEEVEVEEAFESINVEGSADGNLSQVQVYGENVTLSYIVGGTAEAEYEDGTEYESATGLDEEEISAVKVVQSFDIPENVREKFDIADGVTAEITCYISNPKADYKVNLTSPYVNFNCDVTFSCNVSMDVLKAIGVPGNITLARVPVAGIGYIKATLVMSLEGSITLNLVEHIKMGVKWESSTGFQLTKKFTKKAFTIQAQVDANAGVRLEAGFDVAVLKGEVHGEVGAAVSASSITYGEGTPANCTHMQSWLYAEAGASISLDVIVYEKDWSKSVDIYNRNNSPVRVVFHYEDGVPVGVCTRDKNAEDDDPSNDQYKYYTPADSKYGYSGGSGGVDSEGNEYTIFEYEKITTSTIRLTKYNGNVSALSIPSTMDGYKVTELGDNLFKNHDELMMVVIPDTIKTIGGSVFSGCDNLTSVTLPNSIETIGKSAFLGCANLAQITLPDGLETIGSSAFSGCESLTNVIFPGTLITIGGSAFSGCTSLQKIILPNKLENLGAAAFNECESVTEIYIPKSLANVSDGSPGPFAGCVSATTIRLEEGITKIPAHLFRHCEWLESFVIPNTVEEIGKLAFAGCANLAQITLPDGLETIEASAFSGCESLTNVRFPELLTTIGGSAFYNCESLTKVVIGNKVTSLGSSAFHGCTSLEEVTMGFAISKINDSTFKNCESLTSIELLHEVKSIGNSAFAGCESLTEIVIPAKTTSISSSAFTDVEDLTIYGVAGSYAQTFAESKGYTFVARNVPIQSLALDVTEAVIELKGTLQLGVVANPMNFTDVTVWTSSDTTIAKVSDSGLVTAQNTKGVVTITVKAGNYTASCTIKVGNAIEDGLHQAEDGTWYYYLEGEIATQYTGLVEYYGTWYYVENGVLNWGYTGLTEYYGTWYYVEGGVLNWNYTGLTCYYDTWYYVEGGVLNWGYTGLTEYYGTWYYVNGGVLDWGYTGLTEYYGAWYYVEGGVLNWNYTGLTCYYDTWYYVEGGVLNWGYTGLTYYYGEWYYVGGGVLDWSFTGNVYYNGSWWYVENGIMVRAA